MIFFRILLFVCTFLSSLSAREHITFFRSNILVHTDATLSVEECIEVMCEGRDIVRGIVREFPTRYRDSFRNHMIVDFKVQSVTLDGVVAPFRIESVSNGKKVYIGDKDIFLSHGKHTYVITYTTNRQLGFFKDHDELYWNVTGNGWRLPIDKVEARVQLPEKISAELIGAEAYTGFHGHKNKNYEYTIKDNCIIFNTTQALRSYEGLTIVTTFPKGFVVEPSWRQKMYWFFRDNGNLLFLSILILVLMYLCILGWVIARRNNKPGIVIPLFYPPEGLTPSDVGFMSAMKFQQTLLSADIVNLAVRGFITIEQKPDASYKLMLKDTIDHWRAQGQCTTYDLDMLLNLFRNTKQVLEISTKNNDEIQDALKKCISHTKSFVGAYITSIKKILTIGYVVGAIAAIDSFLFLEPGAIKVTILIAIGVLLWLSHLLFRHYTSEGRKLQDAIDGFKLYLITAEIDRMHIIGTPPTRTPELYEKYLPYAMALGVEKQWTKQFSVLFENLAKQGHAYHPLWYHGKRFESDNFGSKFATSFSGAIASASTPPGSSSGSKGSGSSGGGGGGGGGGGW